MENIEEYWEAVKESVCDHCVDETAGEGVVREKSAEECALRRYFPEIVQMVKSVKSDDVKDYELAQRGLICAHCTHQMDDGSCKLRKQLDCCLDRYFVLVLNTILEVDARRAHNAPR